MNIPLFSDIQRINREKQNTVINTAVLTWTDVFVDAIQKWMDNNISNRDTMKIIVPAGQLSGFHQFTSDQRRRILDTTTSKFVDNGWLNIVIAEDDDAYDHNFTVIIEQDMNI